MSRVSGRVGLLPGWSRIVILAALLGLVAALFAQEKQNEERKKNNAPPPKGEVTKGVHKSQPQNHPAGSQAAPAARKSPPAGFAPGGNRSGGSPGGTQNQGSRPGPRPQSNNQAGRASNRPGSPGAKSYGANRAPGRPSVIRSANTTVYRAPGGERRIVHNLPGGAVAVANARGHGYVQRSVTVRGAVYVQRTYYVGGRPQALFYRPYLYRGIAFNVYVPLRFYMPRFYLWAYHPWAAPVYYNWGWAGNPWFGFYAGYFAPYPSYAAPNLWLTDYLLATSLQEAYQERMDAAAAAAPANASAAASAQAAPPAPPPGADAVAPGGQVVLTPEVKQAIADEVRQQLQQEQAESRAAQAPQVSQAPQAAPAVNPAPASTPPPALTPNATHVFIVSSVVVVSANGQQCAVTEGDVLQLDPAADYPDPTNAKVLASKAADCQTGKAVQVGLADLQEMQNHMREMLDQGLGDMQAHQGQGNLPAIAPPMRAQTAAPYAAGLPAPDPNVESELQQTAQAGGPHEPATASPPPAPAPSPATIALGQTISQVVAMMGQPDTKFSSGDKTIYVYNKLKITFTGGKVTDVE